MTTTPTPVPTPAPPQEPETRPATGKTAGFFQCSTNELHRIARLEGSAKDLAAYMVLCGGVDRRQSMRACTHGALSVANALGISRRNAENAIAWLATNDLIQRPPPRTEGGAERPRNRNDVQWLVTDQCPDFAISQQFLLGAKKGAKRPLVAFFERVRGADGITAVEAGIDALILFSFLMRDMDFGAWGGVSPWAWSSRFVPVADGSDENGNALAPSTLKLKGSNVLLTVEEGPPAKTHLYVVDEALSYIEDAEVRRARFWHALKQLRHAQLVYRVLAIWNRDPLGTDRPRHAEHQATLYINDSWAREYDPFIQGEVNRAAWRSHTGYYESEFDKKGAMSKELSGRYRYIVRAGTETQCTVLAQLRVRYWPSNPQTVEGREAERKRTLEWAATLRSI